MATLNLGSCRLLAGGARAFTGIRPRSVKTVRNGCKVFMRRKDSYMVEVNVGEEEPEDLAVRKFMKAVQDSRVVEQLRAKKVKETKIEEYKRRLRERHEARKANDGKGIVLATWEEINGIDTTPRVFDEFFAMDPDGEFGLPLGQDDSLFGGYSDNLWGGYIDQNRGGATNWDQGGYMDTAGAPLADQQGGYINQAAPATSFDAQGNFVYTAPSQ